MIHYLFVHLFYAKRRVFLYLSLFIIPILIYMLSITGVSMNQEFLFREEYQFYYEEMTQKSLYLLIPFFIVLLTMDHDQSFLKPIISYFGRIKTISSKFTIYVIILTWFYFMIFILYHVIPSIFTSYHQISTFSIPYFFNIFLDGIIFMIIILTFIKDRQKAFSVVFAILYILLSLYQEDQESILIFYIIPLYFPSISTFSLAIAYKMCYIFLGLVLSIKKMLLEEI
jgi:hypothetical protein